MTSPRSGSTKCPRILVIGADPALREFCRDGLPWAGCSTEFARDIADAMTGGFMPDVMLADLPSGPHKVAALRHLKEYADTIGSALIALTDDPALVEQLQPTVTVQVLFRPCAPETLWDALAIAITEREAAQ
jgi:CheY-like chemotaxis protein